MDELDELRAPPPRPPSRWAAFFSALACASVNVASPGAPYPVKADVDAILEGGGGEGDGAKRSDTRGPPHGPPLAPAPPPPATALVLRAPAQK